MLEILFYSISILLVICAFMVIFSNHVVYSLLYLILCFLSASFLLFLFECEFLALLYIIIYVGAVAVLFLFSIMIVETKSTNLQLNASQIFPIGVLFGLGFFLILFTEISITFPTFNHNKILDVIENCDLHLNNIKNLVIWRVGTIGKSKIKFDCYEYWMMLPKTVQYNFPIALFDSKECAVNKMFWNQYPLNFNRDRFLIETKFLLKGSKNFTRVKSKSILFPWSYSFLKPKPFYYSWHLSKIADAVFDIEVYGTVLYTEYALSLILLGLILLMVLICVVYLINNFRFSKQTQEQCKFKQLSRNSTIFVNFEN